ncbi:MAG: TIGR03557 family F420-dependent LLM class oxidoreductase [Actinomycetota bacterium]|nr:TIGR03557 family F420-dependent LLM class oxidoreductase [Actinomycetota bacterium]
MRLGCWLSSEEHPPRDLVRLAVEAEQVGFGDAMISDHFHPWTPTQGQSGFVWSTLGAIAHATDTLRVATGVTAPIVRMHPAVVAHAATTVASMMPGRFALGLGSGERLNEQVTGERWPRAGERRRMLSEAIDVIRKLFTGDEVNHSGQYFQVEHAQLFTRPDTPPPIYVAAGGRRSTELAGEKGDGLIVTSPDPVVIQQFEHAGGRGKPKIAQLHVCWADTEREAVDTAMRWWPNSALPGTAKSELARPSDFASLADLVTEPALRKQVVCGPDPDAHLAAIARYAGAGFTLLHIHQVGPDQQGFLRFYEKEILPQFPAVSSA